MHILTKLKMELKAAVEEAGGPSEETFYKVWKQSDRDQYIKDHPQSKFAKESNKNVENKEKNENSKPAKAPAKPKSKEYKDAYNTYKNGYEKYHDPNNSDDLHDAFYESFLIDLDDQSGCDTSDVDSNDINDLFHKKISLDDFVKKYGGNKASDNNKGEFGAILDHFNQDLEI